jgi:hypothetical protein
MPTNATKIARPINNVRFILESSQKSYRYLNARFQNKQCRHTLLNLPIDGENRASWALRPNVTFATKLLLWLGLP